MICKDLHGVEQELLLCANERGQLLKLEPSSNCEDYVAIDSRALLEVDPEKVSPPSKMSTRSRSDSKSDEILAKLDAIEAKICQSRKGCG